MMKIKEQKKVDNAVNMYKFTRDYKILVKEDPQIEEYIQAYFTQEFMSEDMAVTQYGILGGKVDTLTSLPLSFNVAFATALVPAISAAKAIKDYKSILQEAMQAEYRESVQYRVIDEKGPPHYRTFYVEVLFNNIVLGKGEGKSKKEAEQNAAKDALNKKATI